MIINWYIRNEKEKQKMLAMIKENKWQHNFVLSNKKCLQNKKGKLSDLYNSHWKDMPEFLCDTDYKYIYVYEVKDLSKEQIKEVFGKQLNGKSIKFKHEIETKYIRVLGGEHPIYPIFVISKGRSDIGSKHTSYALSQMCVYHYIVVEPQEYEDYSNSDLNDKYTTILKMDLKYKEYYDVISDIGNINSTGPGAARNFCADYTKNELKKNLCWILDDNAYRFVRFWRGKRIKALTPNVFSDLERFVDRYENIGLAGLNYAMFTVNDQKYSPFTINTRIYSFGLWNLNAPIIKQRGRYNEDTIQSLDVLNSGYKTVQFNLYVGDKVKTQRIGGGNTAEFYSKDELGTLPKTQMLKQVYPNRTRIKIKFGRVHHEVDYSGFTKDLKLKKEVKHLKNESINKINENGAYIVYIDPKYHSTENDNKEFLERIYPHGCKNDITNSDIFL